MRRERGCGVCGRWYSKPASGATRPSIDRLGLLLGLLMERGFWGKEECRERRLSLGAKRGGLEVVLPCLGCGCGCSLDGLKSGSELGLGNGAHVLQYWQWSLQVQDACL